MKYILKTVFCILYKFYIISEFPYQSSFYSSNMLLFKVNNRNIEKGLKHAQS